MSHKSPLNKPQILLCDIETAPSLAYIWALFDQHITPDQIAQDGYVLCVSWKWLGDKDVSYIRVAGNERKALATLHKLLDSADVVIHYNGTKFDIPTLHREFVLNGLPPPSPVKQIDLLKTVRKQFKFSSNKLDYVCQRLGLGNKVKHKGLDLWKGCLANNKADWSTMKEYNMEDVRLLERLYQKLLPWVVFHPNHTLYTGKVESCPKCGHDKFQRRGTYETSTMSYTRYQCNKCHGWFRGAIDGAHTKIKHRPVT